MFSKISDYFKIKKQDKEELIELLNSTINNISIAEQEYICIFNNKSSYIDIRKINDWKNKFSKTHDTASSYLKGGMIEKKKIPSRYIAPLNRIVQLYALIDKQRKSHNKKILESGKSIAESIFSKICPGSTPTESQLYSILADDKRILITGAPSTGKTSAMKAKYEYLKEKNHNILFLDGQKTSEFTKLSIDLLNKSNYDTSEFITLEKPTTEMIISFIKNKMSDSIYRSRVLDYYFNFHLFGKTIFDFETQAEYDKYISLCPPITLKGEKVETYEELDVANFLYSLGINYEYNIPFEKDVMLQGARSRYKPNFTLTEYGICINIYTLSKDFFAPFDNEDLTKTSFLTNRIEEIKSIHTEAEIPLIECFTYEKLNGNLLSHIQSALRNLNIDFNIKSDNELLLKIQESDSNFLPILAESIRLSTETILATGESEETILTLSRTKSKTAASLYKRRERMMSLILPFYNYYIKNYKWDDYRLIRFAANKIASLEFTFEFSHIFVDNAECLNAATALLLNVLTDKFDCKIVFAGCGWCSPVSLNATDSVYLQDFGRFYPGYDEIILDKIFNLPYKTGETMINFALNNSGNQEFKPILDKNPDSRKINYIEKTTKPLSDIINDIKQNPSDEHKILILCRYENELDSIVSYQSSNITCSTIFEATGKYDTVILISTKYTDFGFPDERINLNNISDLILRRPDTNFFLGERNLLCKALTLTKGRFIAICDHVNVSDYIEELFLNQ